MKKKILNLLKKLTRKTVLGALALAVALWFFTSLNETYTVRIDIPLNLELPDNRALEDELPQNVTVETRGTGWNLFYLMALNTDKSCSVDLSDVTIQDSLHRVNRAVLLSSVQSFEEVQSVNIFPENLTVKTGQIINKKVPVKPDVTIFSDNNFILTGNIKVEPDSVTLKGNYKVLRELNNWHTEKQIINNAKNDIIRSIPLKDTLTGIVNISPDEVQLIAELQMLADKTFHQIKLDIIGGNIPSEYKIYPEFFDVTIEGGINEIEKIKRGEIQITAELSDILNNQTGVIIPKVEVPENIEIKNIFPKSLYLYKTIHINNLNQISYHQ